MYDRELFMTTVSGFAATLVREYDVGTVLKELTERVIATLGLVGSGVTLLQDGSLRLVTAVPDVAVHLEEAQQDQQQGPCLEATRSGAAVTIPDLRDEAARWPEYAATAARRGILAAAGIPLKIEDTTVGALDLYAQEVRDWSTEDIAAARVLADMATGYLVNASKLDQHRQLSEQLQRALQSRIVIEQAKGMTAHARAVTVDAAFELLRRHARNHNTSVRAVAEAVVHAGLRV